MAQLWVDPFSGLSGDIWVGGFLALGVGAEDLRAVLRRLPFEDLDLRAQTVMRCGVEATKADVVIGGTVDTGGTPHLEGEAAPKGAFRAVRRKTLKHAHEHGYGWAEVDAMLKERLDPRIADVARGAFEKLGRAEARVHGMPLEQVHFHEVGLKDSIADVALAAAGWVLLGSPEVHVGPLALGKGRARMAHGEYPIPGPATLYLLEGFETNPGVAPADKELTTPTGAALAAQLATGRRAPARFIPRKVAFAAGGWDFPTTPNACRFVLGEAPAGAAELLQLEVNVDDATPQQVAFAQARCLEAGALDCWVSPATFKKGRSGWVVACILEPARAEAVAQVLTTELPTLGLRMWPLQRLEADRRFRTARVEGHEVAVKQGAWPHRSFEHPEHDDAKKAARSLDIPLREAQRRATES